MAKKRNSRGAPAAASAGAAAPPAAPAAGSAAAPPADAPPPAEPRATTGTVRALVLYDSVYGRCGEVREFPAAEVEAIAAAGFIDAHPNAVASAGG